MQARPQRLVTLIALPWQRVLLLGLGGLSGCIEQTIDLRSSKAEPGPEPPCTSLSLRANPDSGACEPCTVMQPPPEQVCPCAFRFVAGDFPYCEAEQAAYECLPCSGSIRDCRTYDAARGITTSCELMQACCSELAAVAGALPCCGANDKVNCAPAGILGEYAVSCVTESCCQGTLCPRGEGDCASWQICDPGLGRCVPACEPDSEYCCRECGCVCERSVPAN